MNPWNKCNIQSFIYVNSTKFFVCGYYLSVWINGIMKQKTKTWLPKFSFTVHVYRPNHGNWLTILLKALNTPMLSLMWLHKATHDCLWIRKFCSCTCEADLSLYLYNKCTNTIIWVTENHVLFKNPILYQYIYSWFSDFWKNGIYVYIYLLTPMIYRLQHIYRIVWIHRHVF